jgi:hypothetical protein
MVERKSPSKKEKESLHILQGGKCIYCGRKLAKGFGHVDHIRPVAGSGTNAFSNKQLACEKCNSRKGKLSDGEYRSKYKLTPTRQSNGQPPAKLIPLSYFDAMNKANAKKKAKAKKDKGLFSW